MTIGERIKKIREQEDLSQAAFGAKIGTTRDAINNIERDRNKKGVPDYMVKIISLTFSIDEDWILNGKDDVPKKIRNEKLLLNELCKENNFDEIDRKIIEAYINLNENERQTLKKFLKDVFKK